MNDRSPTRHRVVAAALAVAVVASATGSMLGSAVSLALLFALTGALWILVLAPRIGGAMALATTVVSGFTFVLAVPLLTRVTVLPLFGTVVVALALLGVLASIQVWRRPPRLTKPRLALALASSVGAVAWLGTMALAAVIPGAARLAWVMSGDSANNLLFARTALAADGILLGGDQTPVPLPWTVLTIFIAAGRVGNDSADAVRADVASFGVMWSALIVLLCIMTAAVVASIAKRVGSLRAVLVPTALASLLPMSWLFTGYPIELGILNAHLSFPIVFATFLAFLASDRHPAASLAVLFLSATALLMVWSPLVLIPAALGIAVLVRRGRAVLAVRGWRLWVLIASGLQLVIIGLAVILPTLFAQAGSLVAAGGAFPFRRWFIVLIALAAIGCAIVAFRKLNDLVVIGISAIAVSMALGLGALLFLSRNEADPWTYYPQKFMWLGIVILLTLMIGAAIAAVFRLVASVRVRAAAIAAMTVVVVGALFLLPTSAVTYPWMNPVQRVLTGQVMGTGDDALDEIAELAETGEGHFLWQTDDFWETIINFWVLQLWVDSLTTNQDLRVVAYGFYDHESVDELCRIIGLIGDDAVIHTAEDGLQDEIDATCPGTGARVVAWEPSSP